MFFYLLYFNINHLDTVYNAEYERYLYAVNIFHSTFSKIAVKIDTKGVIRNRKLKKEGQTAQWPKVK